MDRTFVVEVQFFKEMVGAGGEKLLQDRVLALMPTRAEGIPIEKCLQYIQALQRSDLYRFTGSGAQGVVQSVATWSKQSRVEYRLTLRRTLPMSCPK